MNDSIKITSPTGMGIRNDPAGSGHYGAPRGKRRHNGIDFVCVPGQTVKCPIKIGKVMRVARPYVSGSYSGLYIHNQNLAIKIFYIDPWPGIMGEVVQRGEPIGIAQDISERYGGEMKPHVHLAVISFNPEFLLQKEL